MPETVCTRKQLTRFARWSPSPMVFGTCKALRVGGSLGGGAGGPTTSRSPQDPLCLQVLHAMDTRAASQREEV